MFAANKKILLRFPTERYKRFWYPTRPLFTIGLGLILISVGWLGIISISTALWLGAIFAFDDLPFTPLMSLVTAWNNIFHRRKLFKSIVMTVLVCLSIMLGALFGLMVPGHFPILFSTIKYYIEMTSCSPFLVAMGAIARGYMAHASNRASPFFGILTGAFLMGILPNFIPWIVDIVFMCAAASAFVTSIVTKQCLRIMMHYRYGHSNADGYEMDRIPAKQVTFIELQAKKFNMPPQTFNHLITYCRNKINKIKTEATYWQELSGERKLITNTYKDIYFGLMNPHCTQKDVAEVKILLAQSRKRAVSNALCNKTPAEIANIKAITSSYDLRSNLATRTLFHQAFIAPGLPDEVKSHNDQANYLSPKI